jgi:hypothetical protein
LARDINERVSRFGDSWIQLVQAMRTDLGVTDQWQPEALNPPTLDGDERSVEPIPARE